MELEVSRTEEEEDGAAEDGHVGNGATAHERNEHEFVGKCSDMSTRVDDPTGLHGNGASTNSQPAVAETWKNWEGKAVRNRLLQVLASRRKKEGFKTQTDSLLYHLLTQSYTCTQGYEIPEIRVVLAFLTELTLDERFFCKCESGCALSYASLLVVMDFNLIEEVMKHDGDEWCSNSFLLCVVPFVWLEHVPT